MRERASATAHLVGRCVTLLRDDPTLGSLVPAAAADIGREIVAEYRGRWASLVPAAVDRAVTFAIVEAAIPGIVVHYALRKRSIEYAVRAAVPHGVTRLIVLGAGFDTLAIRLAREFPHLQCIEVDHPATQAVKRRAFARLGDAPTNLQFVSADFRARTISDVERELGSSGHAVPTFVVCEGVLMYLDRTEVGALFEAMARLAGRGGQCAFTFMEPGPDGRAWFPGARSIVGRALRAVGEPFDWGIARAALSPFAAEHGLAVREIAGRDELRERYLSGPAADAPLAQGEFICLAVPIAAAP